MSERGVIEQRRPTSLISRLGTMLVINGIVLIASLRSLSETGWDRVAGPLALTIGAVGALMAWSNREFRCMPWVVRALVIVVPLGSVLASVLLVIIIPNGLLPHGMVSYGTSDVRVRRTTDQAELATIATEAPKTVAVKAVKKLTDQRVLLDIALHGPAAVRGVATERLNDQSAIARVVMETDALEIYYEAAGRLTDPVILSKIGMWVKPQLTRDVTDQGLLSKLALQAKPDEVRRAAVERLGDQGVLARVAIADRSERVRALAVERLTNPAILAQMGMWVKTDLTRKVTDQTLLAKLATEAKDSYVRAAAVERLNDQITLTTIADHDKEAFVRGAAVEKIDDQTTLARIATSLTDKRVRASAVEKVEDDSVLVKIALDDDDPDMRRLAAGRVATESSLERIASGAKSQSTRVTAIARMTDQSLLRRWAEQDPQNIVRTAAVARITDDAFLIARLKAEPSASVRAAIIDRIQGDGALREVAIRAYYQADRDSAVDRLRRMGRGMPSDVVVAHRTLAARVKALMLETATDTLLRLTMSGDVDIVREGAARRLTGASVEEALMRSTDRGVLKILLPKLDDKTALSRVAAGAVDPALRLAATRKSGSRSWQSMFEAARAKDAPANAVGDVVAAVSLFLEVQADAIDSVSFACVDLIRRGDETRIPEMVDLLKTYGNKTLAEDYLNSGHGELATAGEDWAQARGFPVSMGRRGSARAKWGSGR